MVLSKKIYFIKSLLKANDKKLIVGIRFNIYIIDIDTLELETTIKLKRIINILIRPKGNIFN